MSEALLTVLKLCFLALLYLFLFQVVRVVLVELRTAPVGAVGPVTGPSSAGRRDRSRGQLVVIEPAERKGTSFPLDDEVTVGRGGGCAVVLADDTFVSQVHARVYRRDSKVYVEDLASTNGTFVNGDRVEGTARVRRGDRVQFGQTVVEVTR